VGALEGPVEGVGEEIGAGDWREELREVEVGGAPGGTPCEV
jgi:hypothetical protein